MGRNMKNTLVGQSEVEIIKPNVSIIKKTISKIQKIQKKYDCTGKKYVQWTHHET